MVNIGDPKRLAQGNCLFARNTANGIFEFCIFLIATAGITQP